MKTSTKIHNFSILLSTFIVFFIWDKWFKDFSYLNNNNFLDSLMKAFATALTSIVFYRLVIKIIIKVLKDIQFIKKLMLKSEFLEGTWVGYYRNGDGKLRFYYEVIEHDIYNDNIRMHGEALNENKGNHAEWDVICSKLDSEYRKLYTMYRVNSLHQKGNNVGLSELTFVGNDKNSAPKSMRGTAIDAHEANKMTIHCKKISDKLNLDTNKMFEQAEEFYKREK